MSSQSGIYLITNTINNSVYIGSAFNMSKRFGEHIWALQKGCHCNVHLQRAWDKYGELAFLFKEYFICNTKDLILFEQLTINYFIDHFGRNTLYNLCLTAGNTTGRIHSYETKKKIGKKSKGRSVGRKHTEDELIKMSLSQKGKSLTKKHRENISKGRKGIKVAPFTEEHKEKIRIANIGHEVSIETRIKLSIANKGRRHTEEAKRKIGDAFRGKPGTRLGIKNKTKKSKVYEGLGSQREF